MRVYRLHTVGRLESLVSEDEPGPRPGPGEVLVRVEANSLNFRDLKIILGGYVLPVRPGVIPLSDAAGVVIELGAGVSSVGVGDRVINAFYPTWQGGPTTRGQESYGADRDGWLTDLKVVRAEALLPIPAHLTFEEAATLPCAALTAWSSLAGVRAGETVLTQGSGGVAVFAIQLAKALGARVIATTGSAPERLRALGSDLTIDAEHTPRWGDAVRAATGGRGVDRVVEVGGPGTLAQSLAAVAYGGEIAVVGARAATGDHAGLDFLGLFTSQATLRCIGVGSRSEMAAMLRAIDANKLRPVIDSTHSFDDPRAAVAHYNTHRVFGKVVVRH